MKKLFKSTLLNDIAFCAGISLACGIIFNFCAEVVRCNGFISAVTWIADHKWAFLIGSGALLIICFGIIWVTRRGVFAVLVGFFLFVGSFVNFYKLAYRGDPLLPIDFVIALDAAKVAGELHIPLTTSMWVFLAILAACAALLWKANLTREKGATAAAVNITGSLVCVPLLVAYLALTIWNTGVIKHAGIKAVPANAAMSYETTGFTAGYLMYLNQISPQKPNDYSMERVNDAIAQLSQTDTSSTPDIIVVMLESYYHLTNYPNGTTENIMECYKQLAKEGVSGYYLSDKYSGGTADMEFGALTGFSTSLLPTGSVPYSQYVTKDKTPSYMWHLKDKGYTTTAIHPYDGTIYKRNAAYPRLGFDEFITQEQFNENDKKGVYISDKSVMDKIIKEYEAKKQNGAVFIHAVTMQNHIPNNGGEYGNNTVSASYPNVPQQLSQSFAAVATGLKDEDAAMGYLTDYLRKQDRPCVVLFFGDHQTSIGNHNGKELLDYANAFKDVPTEARVLATHRVPYLMWSNYQSPNAGTKGDFLPPYMLLAQMADMYDLPATPWFTWLQESRQILNGVNLGYSIIKNTGLEQNLTQQQQELLNNQALLQYDALFGENYGNF